MNDMLFFPTWEQLENFLIRPKSGFVLLSSSFFFEGGRSEVGVGEVSFGAIGPYSTLHSKVCSQDHMIEYHRDNGVECLRT